MIGSIAKYGVYNSKKVHKNEKITPIREVENFEFDYILSCDLNAVSYINEKSCRLAPNMLIIRKPHQKSNSRLHFKCYCLHLKIEKTSPLYLELLNTPEYFTFISDATYRPIFESLLKHLANGYTTSDYFTSAKILELIYNVKKDEKFNNKIKHHTLKKEHHSIQKAITYMKKHYDKNVTLDFLGDLTGYSPNHFRRLFVSIIGTSPTKYLENIRVSRAQYLIMQNEKSLTEIAYECGFSSQAYFSQVFKKTTLLTPAEFQATSLITYKNN